MNTTSPRVDDTFFEEVTDAVTEAIVGFEGDGTLVFVNPAARNLLGYASNELLERSIDELFPNAQRSELTLLKRQAMGEGSASATFTLQGDRDHEVPITLDLHCSERDDRHLFIANFHEQQARAETDSDRGPETALESVLEDSADGVAVFDPKSLEIVDYNDRFRAFLGRSDDESRSLELSDLSPHDEELLRTHLQETIDEGRGWRDDIQFRDSAGDSIRVVVSTERVERSDRPYVLAHVHPQTERTEYERRLKALNEASRRLMDAGTPEEIGQVTIDVVETVLQRSLTAVWHAGDDEDGCHAIAASGKATRASGGTSAEPIAPIRAGTAEMAVFEAGEPALIDGYETVSNPAHPEMRLESRLVVPLGKHGLLAVGSTGGQEIDGPLQELIEILGKNVRAAFDRLEHERLNRRRAAAIDAAIDGMAITNEDGVFTDVNDVYARLFGYEESSAIIGEHWKQLFSASEVARYESDVLPVVATHESWRGEATGRTVQGGEIPVEISLSMLADGCSVCIARDITERKARERQLEELTDGIRELMSADDREEVARIGIEAIEEILGYEVACVRLFDSETNTLDRVAVTGAANALLESQTASDLESTLASQAFREEQTVVGPPTTERTASLHVPIGTFGVLTLVATSDDAIDEHDVQVTEMLAANARTAMARAERVRLLRTHEREMRTQRDQLETHNRINKLVQELGRQLLEATTREELESTVCSRLVNADPYHSAWIGDVEVGTDNLTTRVGFGIADSDLEAINTMSVSSIGHGTVERALESGSAEVVRSYQFAGTRSKDDSERSDDHVLSTAAVPLTYGENLFGVLVINGFGEELFREETISGFESLGKIIGFAINAVRNRRLLLSDSVIELELVVSDPESFYLAVSNELDCECRFERAVPIEAGRILNYHTVTGSDPTAVLELASTSDRIEDARIISDDDESLLLQTVTSKSTTHVALQGGATLRSAVAVDGEGRIVLEAPQTANVREIVSLFEGLFSSVDLVAKRERDRSLKTAAEFRQTVDEGLTEKQRSALESAYASGYYDWPRAITAEELATSMGVSSSTLHQHLRKGIWGLLEAFLDDHLEGASAE